MSSGESAPVTAEWHEVAGVDDAVVLRRGPDSIAWALGQPAPKHHAAAGCLAECTGRGAIFRFLRLSMRLEHLPPSLLGKAAAEHARFLRAAPGEALTAVWIGQERHFVDTLERGRKGRHWNALPERLDALLQVYLGHPDMGSAAANAVRVAPKVRHRAPMALEAARACLRAALMADDTVSVGDFAAQYFGPLEPLPAVALPPRPPDPPPPARAPASTAAVAALEGLHALPVIALDSLRRQQTHDRVHVPSAQLPTRHAQQQALVQAACLSMSNRRTRLPHALLVVSGPVGIGKSAFIHESLLHLRSRSDRPADEVLYLTNAAQLAEDVVADQVRACLEGSAACPLLVIDGLRVVGDELQWHGSGHAGQQASSNDLPNLLLRHIGRRSFVAVLGVQTSPLAPSGVPGRLQQHPTQPMLGIADELRLQPLLPDEARVFARQVMSPRRLRDAELDRLAQWSGGLPLLLGAASALPQSQDGELRLPGPAGRGQDAEQGAQGARMWHHLRGALQQLNEHDGPHHAVMRLVSLFRRSQSPEFIRSVVLAVQRTGLDIKRINEDLLRMHLSSSPFFSQGSEGRVELHEGVREIIGQDLASVLRDDPVMAHEVRTIHLVASRLCYQRLHARGGLGAEAGAPAAAGATERLPARPPETPYDLELICDCVHHLLGTRGNGDPPCKAQVAWHDVGWADELDAGTRHALSGVATAEEIEQFCYRKLLGRRLIEGHAFSDRGLFAHKLALLKRFTEGWAPEPTGRPVSDQIRRSVRRELGACSLVAGRLGEALAPLQQVLDELACAPSAGLPRAVAGGRERQQERGLAVNHCVEIARVSAILATAQLRMGRIVQARLHLERVVQSVVAPTQAWIRQFIARGQEDLARDYASQVHLAHSRLLVRLAEAAYLAAASARPGAAATLAEPLQLFEQANLLQIEHARGRTPGRRDAASKEPAAIARQAAVPADPAGGGLSGESARARVRCLLASAQLAGRLSDDGAAHLLLAKALIESQLMSPAQGLPPGWASDAIGFGLLRATVGLLEGRVDDAEAELAVIDRNPKYLNLGACSQAVKFELRLTRAKVALARADGGVLPAALRADLLDLEQHAGETRHLLLRMDALLLLAIASPGGPVAAQPFLGQAQVLSEECPDYRARDDVFDWFAQGRLSPWRDLTIAA